MTEGGEKALLPAGLQDLLAPDAAHEAATVDALLSTCMAFGYERVKPPLIEFEETLLAGAGAAVAQQSFRLMDPVSQRMMAVRADITPQVARIAATRLRRAPRPLRLCYGGQVLRVRGTQLRPERQVSQAGAELIGAAQADADAEVAVLAAEALTRVGVANLSIDLNQPTLVGAIARGVGLPAAAVPELRARLDRKDAAAISHLAGSHSGLFLELLRTTGPIEQALGALARLDLPEAARPEVAKLEQVARLVRSAAPELGITIDPVEHRGFEYQTGVSFTLFARDARGELGRGGRYMAERLDGSTEPATGFTLYMDTICRILTPLEQRRRIYLPQGTVGETARALRADGWITVGGLAPVDDPAQEARRLGCSHVWRNGSAEQLED